ncbi:MAG TPA: iron-sulfur cluster assembly protein, partial [Actinomycetota bacterium]|nr:iron-sulfur cluster assembly protein [Actinomycetota bacterium]
MATEAQVREALKNVRDPEIGRPIDEIGMLKGVEVQDGVVRVHVLITIEGCPLKDRITGDVTAALQPLEGVERVEVELTSMSADEREALVSQLRGQPGQPGHEGHGHAAQPAPISFPP